MRVVLLVWLCCVIYFIQIKEKGLLNPSYSFDSFEALSITTYP